MGVVGRTGFAVWLLVASVAGAQERHGLSIFGDLKYPADFTHFAYANPEAPKGGAVVLEGLGSFDTFNPFIIKGSPFAGIGSLYDTLLAGAADEATSAYGLVARAVEYRPDEGWVIFHLREQARFHDGHPITAEDVAWTFRALQEHGRPVYRFYYQGVEKVEVLDAHRVKFVLKNGNKAELVSALGQLVVLPRHYWESEGRDITRTTLEPPLGSGPYRIVALDPGRSVTLARVEDYWGRDLAVKRGFDNFDTIRYDYYRDRTISREAFKAGAIDLWVENSSKAWARAYDFPAVHAGHLVRKDFAHGRVAPMQGIVFNTRRALFRDRRVRWALTHAWDFEWVNRNIMYGAYVRTDSYFDNHTLAATGVPEGAELALLSPHRASLPAEVFEQAYRPPSTDGSGNNRANLKTAVGLLKAAGWSYDQGRLVFGTGKTPFRFSILLRGETLVPHIQVLVRGLKKIGIEARIHVVDDAQYERHVKAFDYDMLVAVFAAGDTPGAELYNRFGRASVERPGSGNLAGVHDEVVDALIEAILQAPNRDVLTVRVQALDRVLLWGHYMIPMYHGATDRVAYWNRFGMPGEIPYRGVQMDTWWVDDALDAALQGGGS